MHKKVRARWFHGKNFACVCSGKNLDINEFWWEVQNGRQASCMHPMVSSGNHTHGDQASEERRPGYNCHPKDGHRKIHTSDSGHCSMKESQSPLQRTVLWGWSLKHRAHKQGEASGAWELSCSPRGMPNGIGALEHGRGRVLNVFQTHQHMARWASNACA